MRIKWFGVGRRSVETCCWCIGGAVNGIAFLITFYLIESIIEEVPPTISGWMTWRCSIKDINGCSLFQE
jgi:hypothetical protein